MDNLMKNQKTLMISSNDKDNNLNISCAAYVYKKNKIYIYISKIAKHYDNLLINPKISVMIIEDEKDAKTVFDRKRISLKCIANKIEHESKDIFKLFDESHGAKMMKILKTMDFDIFELEILNGRFIAGFSKVFDIYIKENEFVLKAVNYQQHTKK
ncbi:pyridoxamine 5'-phosphate oxidase family protein [Romboutsia sp.]|uniref:pyridoxamine 5'-phosphate oxidase family protein n=1 Tax=Romboutsia sp. TaxID=1965302 RepID=UPI002BD70C57|nr:pyridoxamine 5'-phosphate oxidase family protein [Romboutsia sp.]HSQ87876.1 pyridoxamine 5'-phosphate oxidase family protein [Romboutsia sp.]